VWSPRAGTPYTPRRLRHLWFPNNDSPPHGAFRRSQRVGSKVLLSSRILGSCHSTLRTAFKEIQYSEVRLLCGFQRCSVPITPVHCTELILGDERSTVGKPMLTTVYYRVPHRTRYCLHRKFINFLRISLILTRMICYWLPRCLLDEREFRELY
jgi:hypothetical protein